MDIDIAIEHHDNFVIIEGKPWQNGVVLPYGQHKTLYAFSKIPKFQVFLIGDGKNCIHVAEYAKSPRPVIRRNGSATAWWPPNRFKTTSRDKFVAQLQRWWDST